jgi:FKBP-type peptidyl-prolyl cis-trans isomerase
MDSVKCRAALLFLAATAACSSGGSSTSTPSTAASPAATTSADLDEVQRTTFAPSLGIDLTKMIRRPSGLYVRDYEAGTGTVASRDRTAVVRYNGIFPDGKVFDSGEITVVLDGKGKVIRAWEEGLLGMRVGGKRRLVSPPHLAYGARGAPPTIPPNAVLVFDMSLLSVY